MMRKCLCPECGKVHDVDRAETDGLGVRMGYPVLMCAECVALGVRDREILAAARCRILEDRPLTQAQERYLQKHPKLDPRNYRG